MRAPQILFAALLALAPALAGANYVGTLKPPRLGLDPGTHLYLFASPAVLGLNPSLTGDGGQRLKLGYRPWRFLAVEGEYVDYSRVSSSPFTSPASLASGFRGTGFGVDTVAMLPSWNRLSLYGRFGAYRGDARPAFAPYSTSLLLEPARGTRMRYGLGMQYDFNKALGVRAELERYSPLGASLPAEVDGDVFSVGVMWRF